MADTTTDADVTTLTTACPAITFSAEGLTVPDLADVLTGALTDMQTAFGSSLNIDLSSPQGQLAGSLAAIIADKNDQCLAFSNNVNPDYSSGRFQDGIGRIYLMDRKAATGTVVTARCTGLVNTVIPAGATAQDTSGYIYMTSSDATIGSNGYVDVEFTNTLTGEIECAIGALSTIYKAISGWSGITNTAAGVVGRSVESRSAFEWRRRQSVANNSKNTDGSVLGSLLALDGVTDVYVWSNNTTTTQTKGSTSVEIPRGVMFISIYGGASADIANVLYNKMGVCATMGSTSYTITDTTNYSSNYPEYTFSWTVPTAVSLYVKVTLENNGYLPSTITSDVQTAVTESFNGDDDGTRATIGSILYAGRYYGNVQAIDSQNVNILSITLSRDGTTFSNSVEFGLDEIPTLSSSNITVTLSDDS